MSRRSRKIYVINMTTVQYAHYIALATQRAKRRRLRLRRAGLNINGKPYKHPGNRARFSLEGK